MRANPIYSHSVLLIVIDSFIKSQVKLMQNGFSKIPCVAKFRSLSATHIRSRRKLSGWHSFADPQVQDTATFNIPAYNFRDHVPVRLLFIDRKVRLIGDPTKKGTAVRRMPWTPIVRMHARVLEAKIRVAYSLAVRKRVGERTVQAPVESRRAMQPTPLVKPASLCAFRQPRAVVEVSACTLFFSPLPRAVASPLGYLGFWISRIRFQMPKWVIGCDAACVHIRRGPARVNSTM